MVILSTYMSGVRAPWLYWVHTCLGSEHYGYTGYIHVWGQSSMVILGTCLGAEQHGYTEYIHVWGQSTMVILGTYMSGVRAAWLY